jgi:hypothetical protein
MHAQLCRDAAQACVAPPLLMLASWWKYCAKSRPNWGSCRVVQSRVTLAPEVQPALCSSPRVFMIKQTVFRCIPEASTPASTTKPSIVPSSLSYKDNVSHHVQHSNLLLCNLQTHRQGDFQASCDTQTDSPRRQTAGEACLHAKEGRLCWVEVYWGGRAPLIYSPKNAS